MSHKASIPDPQGYRSKDIVDFDVMTDLFSDITVFNYYEKLISDHRRGEMTSTETKLSYALIHHDYTLEKHTTCNQRLRIFGNWFNFVAVRSIIRAFTEIDAKLKEYQEESDFFNLKRKLLLMNQFKTTWIADVAKESMTSLTNLEERVERYKRTL
mmetsp:Transcript_12388/g.19298  ORF Transcript_12388/g.19298 Transcript_12388/m.19298 type:complete len:156 (+) Transcript_12388:203-670(+)